MFDGLKESGRLPLELKKKIAEISATIPKRLKTITNREVKIAQFIQAGASVFLPAVSVINTQNAV